MADEIEKLKSTLSKATPEVDEQKKLAVIQSAKKNLRALQGSEAETRPIHIQPAVPVALMKGFFTMLTRNLRPALYATSCLAVVGFSWVLVSPDGPAGLKNPDLLKTVQAPEQIDETAMAPEIAPASKQKPVAEAVTDYSVAQELEARVRTASPQAAGGLANDQLTGIILAPEGQPALTPDSRDQFERFEANPLKIAVEEPVSTFSIDVDTASYAWVRSSILNGQLPETASVRIEEMVNYFTYDYPAPDGDVPFSTNIATEKTPWNEHTKLVRIGLQGALPAVDERSPLNLVFLIDTSGSMNQPDKLPLLKQSFRLLLSSLRPEDKVAIVTYAGSAGQVLAPTSADQTATILASLDQLQAGGSTAGQAGLQQAYSLAQSMAGDERIGRVILATDGDFNVGISDPEELENYIATKRDSGVYLSVLGFGRGNYNDHLMQSLAQNGNGTASYIDTLAEAQKSLVDQVTGSLFPIANDVKIQVEFNPSQVAEYRLIGYESRSLARENFNNDKVDAGEIGAGHQVTAIYEVTPVGSPARLSDPLRYAEETVAAGTSPEMAYVKLRYKKPGSDTSEVIGFPVPREVTETDPESEFAIAIAGFGQLLSDSKYVGNWGLEEAIKLAQKSKGKDPFGYRAEAIRLMMLARGLSQPRPQ